MLFFSTWFDCALCVVALKTATYSDTQHAALRLCQMLGPEALLCPVRLL